jgi:hypothetical protein
MVRARSSPATPEEYEEWLGRLEKEEALPEDWEQFQDVLRGQIKWHGMIFDYNDAQIDKLWELKGVEKAFNELGITRRTYEFPWGTEFRYSIQGLQGAFGWASVQKIMQEEQGWWK